MFVRATLVVAAMVMAAIGSASPAYSSPGGGGCYIAESGDCVPYPQRVAHSRQVPLPNAGMEAGRSVRTRMPAEHATDMAACNGTCDGRIRTLGQVGTPSIG